MTVVYSDVHELRRVLLDMDGVLTNFDKMADEHHMRKENGKCDWKKIEREMGSQFWSEMEWMPNGYDLFNTVFKFCQDNNLQFGILSAIFLPCGKRGKMEWLEKHCPFIDKKNIFIADKGLNKYKFMQRGDALIDDKDENLMDIPCGTFGIQFKGSIEDVMDQLKMAINLHF